MTTLKVKATCTKSGVWKFFDDCLDGQHARCKICLSAGHEVKYKLSGGSIKSLRGHLERKHRAEWQDMRGDEEAKEVNKSLNALEYLKIFEMMMIMNKLAMKMRKQGKSTKASTPSSI